MSLSCHVWLPELAATHGGIQRYSGFLLAALRQAWPEPEYEVFLKNDRSNGETFPGVRVHASGGLPARIRTPAFAARVAAQTGVEVVPGLGV